MGSAGNAPSISPDLLFLAEPTPAGIEAQGAILGNISVCQGFATLGWRGAIPSGRRDAVPPCGTQISQLCESPSVIPWNDISQSCHLQQSGSPSFDSFPQLLPSAPV